MQKGEADMKRRQIVMRLDADPQDIETIGDIAHHQGRSKGRQIGILAENAARAFREDPNATIKVKDLFTPQMLAAVA